MWILVLLVLGWLLLALIPASIASEKGRSFGGFYVFALCFFVPALIVALLSPDPARASPPTASSGLTKSCPHCLSSIPRAATVCSQCRRDVPTAAPVHRPPGRAVAGAPTRLDSGSYVCTTAGCDAQGIRTREQVCPVCDSRLTSGPRQPDRSVPVAAAASPGVCANTRCQAAGIRTTARECSHCGYPVSQPA